MSELPSIDAMLDQGIAQMREAIEGTSQAGYLDDVAIQQCLEALAERYPWGHLIGMGYHLGMLTVVRADCAFTEEKLDETP